MNKTDMSDRLDDYEVNNLDFYRKNHGLQLYYNWSGEIWWQEEPDKPKEKLFSIIGMNATKVFIKIDPEYGEVGYRINRELGLFCDPVTQEILTSWKSPKASKAIPVVHIANRIVQGSVKPKKYLIPKGSEYITSVMEIPLEYPHPLAEDSKYLDYCPGEKFRGVEYFTSHVCRPNVSNVPPAQWARDCSWMPWMKLGYGHQAKLRFETTISRVNSFEELNPKLVQLVREKVPIYEFAPMESDEPNMTSIQYFKKHFESYLKGEIFPLEETC
ncbi:DUF1838 family protein [Dendronalium sp. ChiSLP03b]|uniref:DUF1838 family protein n=1 Tax=Dendronalium sp. ChiSLP03b TaxID=3075381 RepID=UPI002AD5A441|nr:DUF1838 family protein [Dendronalium sp. ChiSLP03b]MDZ8203395.1 DUF1838 family protein [Dendronalium sp. ChiSLP03b]